MSDTRDTRPPRWDEWPRSEKISYLAEYNTRAGLIMRLLGYADYPPARAISPKRRLKKAEFAAILLAFEEKCQ